MSVKATIDGEVWEFDTVAEAAEFRRSVSLHTEQAPKRRPTIEPRRKRGRPRKTATESPSPRSQTRLRVGRVSATNGSGLSTGSRQILETLRRQPGLHSEEFARAIGSPGPTSLPPRMMMLGKQLKALGLKPDEVVQRDRVYVKGRARSVFKPGPRLDDVLRRTGDLFGGTK